MTDTRSEDLVEMLLRGVARPDLGDNVVETHPLWRKAAQEITYLRGEIMKYQLFVSVILPLVPPATLEDHGIQVMRKEDIN